MMQFN